MYQKFHTTDFLMALEEINTSTPELSNAMPCYETHESLCFQYLCKKYFSN